MSPAPGADPVLAGAVLAAGGGTRMGTPKALLTERDGTPRTVRTAVDLLEAGCRSVTVVLGAAGAQAEELLSSGLPRPAAVRTVHNPRWATGMASSLRVALQSMAGPATPAAPMAVLVTLVDLPDVGAPVMRRVVERWRSTGSGPDALLRATYDRSPGHPVLLGRSHWAALAAELDGDSGARSYLRRHRVTEVICDDLASGHDVDRPDDLVGRG